MLPQLLYFLQIITLLGTVGWGMYEAYTAIQNWHERKEREQRKLKRAQWAQAVSYTHLTLPTILLV